MLQLKNTMRTGTEKDKVRGYPHADVWKVSKTNKNNGYIESNRKWEQSPEKSRKKWSERSGAAPS
jgi:hypothetical protein